MSAIVQKLIQDDLGKLEATYGRDAVLAVVIAAYELVPQKTAAQLQTTVDLLKDKLTVALEHTLEIARPLEVVPAKEKKVFSYSR